jgi:hypothetical protein
MVMQVKLLLRSTLMDMLPNHFHIDTFGNEVFEGSDEGVPS